MGQDRFTQVRSLIRECSKRQRETTATNESKVRHFDPVWTILYFLLVLLLLSNLFLYR